eukprot:m.35178 g.35178  ORF g.35178 m.35178 type:complete len:234 (+) comp7418_c0_seq1:213-914(+)
MQEVVTGAPGAAVEGFVGRAEVEAAATAIAEYLSRGGESPAAIEAFRTALACSLAQKYSTHWWIEQPSRGEGFRHLSCGRDRVDPVVAQALRTAGIPLSRLAAQLPRELSLWCDPGAVTTRIGGGDLRIAQVNSGQWTPPVSPAGLSAAAREFKPSPPSSPLVGNDRDRLGWGGPPGLTQGDSLRTPHQPRNPYHTSDAMTPPFARFGNVDPMGFYQQHQQPPLNFHRQQLLY